MTFNSKDDKDLLTWEKTNADEYLRGLEAKDSRSQEMKFRKTYDK
jgi:hypothetical protein